MMFMAVVLNIKRLSIHRGVRRGELSGECE